MSHQHQFPERLRVAVLSGVCRHTWTRTPCVERDALRYEVVETGEHAIYELNPDHLLVGYDFGAHRRMFNHFTERIAFHIGAMLVLGAKRFRFGDDGVWGLPERDLAQSVPGSDRLN